MKKYLLLLLIPVIFYFLRGKEEQRPSAFHSAQSPANNEKARQLFLSKRTSVPADSVTENPCVIAAGKLNDIDFNIPVKEWLAHLDADTFIKCTDPELKDRVTVIRNSCFTGKIVEQECFTNLLMFRSSIRARSIKDPSTREELADMILSEFSKKEPDFKKLKEFSGELLRQDPNDKPVQKVWAMSAVIAGDPRKLSPELIDEIYQNIDPGEMKTDPELRSLEIIMKTNLKPLSVEEYTRNALKEDQKDLSSREMLGWSLWQQGRREEAIAEVDAILAQKDDPYLRKIREQLVKPDAKLESYPGRLSLGVKLEDLWD